MYIVHLSDEVVGGADGDGAGEVGETMDRGRVVQVQYDVVFFMD